MFIYDIEFFYCFIFDIDDFEQNLKMSMRIKTFSFKVNARNAFGELTEPQIVTLDENKETIIDIVVNHTNICNRFEILYTSNVADEQTILDANCQLVHQIGIHLVSKIYTCINGNPLFEWHTQGIDLEFEITQSMQYKDFLSSPVVRSQRLIDNLLGDELGKASLLTDYANFCSKGNDPNQFVGSTMQSLSNEERQMIIDNGTFYHEIPQITRPGICKYQLPNTSTIQRILEKRSKRCLLCYAENEAQCAECQKELQKNNAIYTIRLHFRPLKELIIQMN